MDNKSVNSYDIVISRPVNSNNEMPLLKMNENNEYMAIPVKKYYNYIFIHNLFDNLINLFCCDNKRK